MSFKPYIPDVEAWIAHFSGTDHLEHKKIHIIKEVKPALPEDPIRKLVTQTAQVQDKTMLEREPQTSTQRKDIQKKFKKKGSKLSCIGFNNQEGKGLDQVAPPPPGIPNKMKERSLQQL